jgi:glucose/arabinose dehydrogenase/mono/diheme cytochrome c family protein
MFEPKHKTIKQNLQRQLKYPLIIFGATSIFISLLSMSTGVDKTGEKFYQADTISSNKQIIAKGQALFTANCSACHNFMQKAIGPNLTGVTAAEPVSWLKKFIHNAPEMIKNGDERAVKLFNEYKVPMLPFTQLSDADVNALLAYMNTFKKPVVAPVSKYGEVLKDPIPTKIPKAGLQLMLEEVTTAPASAAKAPLARINQMKILPGKVNRLFINDLQGKLYEMTDNKLTEVMDVSKVSPNFINAPGLATGFGSVAFHPEFYKNGLLYTIHSEKARSATADFAYADSIPVALQYVLTEWKIRDPAAKVFNGTPREMMRVNFVVSIHDMQEVAFNPWAKPGSADYGLLYLTLGDGGAGEQHFSHLCIDNSGVWGKVLRINPLGKNSKNGKYGIPASNPFAGDTDPKTLGEVYARGFRNPNRLTWPADGKILITDIGLRNAEEINILKPGVNYGWPEREGTFAVDHKVGSMDVVYARPVIDKPTVDTKHPFTYPVAQFDHDEGNAISGGFIYTGTDPLLKGKYIFGEIVTGRVFCVDYSALVQGKQAQIRELDVNFAGEVSTFKKIVKNNRCDLRFGMGPDNQFYIFTKTDGKIWKLKGAVKG